MTNPLVSIIVPSFNQGRFIRDTIESCLSQDYRPIEILVIDGASTDGTVDILHEYDDVPEVKWVSEPDSGPVEAVNKGFARVKGEVGLIQSADDLSLPRAFSRAMQAFRQESGIGLVYSDCAVIDAAGKTLCTNQVGEYSLCRLLSRQTYIPQPCAFFRLSLARKLGGWDERFPYCPDTELWFKIAMASRVRKLDAALGCTRRHESQRDRQEQSIVQSYRRMVRESPSIRRAHWSLRRAVFCGYCVLHFRYGWRSPFRAFFWAWRATVSYPPVLLGGSFPIHHLVPFYFVWAGMVGRIRRCFMVPTQTESKH